MRVRIKKSTLVGLILAALTSPVYSAFIDQITFYPSSPSLVQESYSKLSIQQGILAINSLPKGIDLSSISIHHPPNRGWRYAEDMSDKKEFWESLKGKKVFLERDKQRLPYTYLAHSADGHLLKKGSQIHIHKTGTLVIPKIHNSIFKPELRIIVRPDALKDGRSNVSYLLNSLQGDIQYQASFDSKRNKLSLISSLLIRNNSQKRFKNMKLFVHSNPITSYTRPKAGYMMALNEVSNRQSEGFFQYELGGLHSIENGVNMIPIFDIQDISAKRKYKLESSSPFYSRNHPVKIVINLSNRSDYQWVAGPVRCIYNDIFLTNSQLSSTMINEDVQIDFGSAIDIKANRQVQNVTKHKKEVLITLENSQKSEVTVEIVERFPNSQWKIESSETSYERLKDGRYQFQVKVPAGDKSFLRYTSVFVDNN